jgi:hypothetical protein
MVTLRPVIEEARRIAQLTQLNISFEEYPYDKPAIILINRLVLAEIVAKSTMVDEELCVIIERYFFNGHERTKQFKVFRDRILDELYLLKKMEMVHAIKDISTKVRNIIYDLNAMRNVFAHSLYPESRRAHKMYRKIFYRGKDLRTYEGLKIFIEDTNHAHMYLSRRSLHMKNSPKQKKIRLSTAML